MFSEKSDTWCSSSYFNELKKEDKAKYKHKLTLTNGQLMSDPYGNVENWKSDAKLMSDVSILGWHVQLPCKFSRWIHSGQPESFKNNWKLSNFLFATKFNAFIIMKLPKNLNFAGSKQSYKNV